MSRKPSPAAGARPPSREARSSSRDAGPPPIARDRARSTSTSSAAPSRSSSRSSASGSRSLTVNEREIIHDRDEMCLFCGVSAGSQVAHVMSRTRQADHEVDWMRKFMAQPEFSKRHSHNLMLLCPTHHSLYDNGSFTIVPTEKNLAFMIAFEERDFERREAALRDSPNMTVPDRRVPALKDLEPVVEIIWIHGDVTMLQFCDHNLQVLNGKDVPQSIVWTPINSATERSRRKLEFYPSPYGYQVILDVSNTGPQSVYGHRISPYALLARSFSTLIRATYPINDRVNHVVQMILHLRSLYNRIPKRHWVSHNPWAKPPSLVPSPPPQNFASITWETLQGHPSWEREEPLVPPASPERGSALARGGPRPPFVAHVDTKSRPGSSGRRPRPGGVFGEAISAATGDAFRDRERGRTQTSASGSKPSRSSKEPTSRASGLVAAAQLDARPASVRSTQSPSSSADRTTEYESSKDPLDIISLPDMFKLTLNPRAPTVASARPSSNLPRKTSLSQHPAISHRVGGAGVSTSAKPRARSRGSGGALGQQPGARKHFAVPPPRAQTIASTAGVETSRPRSTSAPTPAPNVPEARVRSASQSKDSAASSVLQRHRKASSDRRV